MTDANFLSTLEDIINTRIDNPEDSSYTNSLLTAGTKRIAQKVGEEGVEVALAAMDGNLVEIREEAADLLYHLLVLLRAHNTSLAEVCSVLEERHKS